MSSRFKSSKAWIAPSIRKKGFRNDNLISPGYDWEKDIKKIISRDIIEESTNDSKTMNVEEKELRNKKESPMIETTDTVRMQEIEKVILSSGIFRIIDGTLCVWEKRYYRALDSRSFAKVLRQKADEKVLWKISGYRKIREAYDYIMVNSELTKAFSYEALQRKNAMIALKNGIFFADTDEFVEAEPKFPVQFYTNAKYMPNSTKTTTMDKIINEATGYDKDCLILFYEVLGYILSQGIEAKKFIVFGTAPDSGKSIIGRFITEILKNEKDSDDNISSIELNNLGERFAMGKINRATVNICMDLPAGELDKRAIQRIKQLTGDPRIECEEKYVQSSSCVHHCKFIFGTNHPILLKADDPAFWNRMILIPFINSVPPEGKDYNIFTKLMIEKDAIVNKSIRAFSQLYKNNFVFTEPAISKNIIAEWRNRRESHDSIFEKFCDERCMRGNEDDFIPTDIIFKAYRKFAKEKDEYIADNQIGFFSKKLQNKFNLKPFKGRYSGYKNPMNGYRGITLKDEKEEESDYEKSVE